MSKLDKALYALNRLERASGQEGLLYSIDARAKLLVTLVYLVTLLSFSLGNLPGLILFAVYPIIACAMAGMSYGRVLLRSLAVLPFIVFIGIFNPVVDRQVVFQVGTVGVTAGWISFFAILVRGLLSVQAVLVLIFSTGFYNLCRGMQRMGVPALFANQLLFVYRYLFVLLEEALRMQRARDARSFGRTSYPLRMWGIFIGQLLIRTVERAERIHRAMLSRGFAGNIESCSRPEWHRRDTVYLVAWTAVFVILRIAGPAALFTTWIHRTF